MKLAIQRSAMRAELVRVCKAGGKIGLANWTPQGRRTFAERQAERPDAAHGRRYSAKASAVHDAVPARTQKPARIVGAVCAARPAYRDAQTFCGHGCPSVQYGGASLRLSVRLTKGTGTRGGI